MIVYKAVQAYQIIIIEYKQISNATDASNIY